MPRKPPPPVPPCSTCLERGTSRPLGGRIEDPDGQRRCRNHSMHPDEVARRETEGKAGAGVAKGRRHMPNVAGLKPTPEPESPPTTEPEAPPTPAPAVPDEAVRRLVDFSTPDAVTGTMERIGAALLANKLRPDNVAVFTKMCEVAAKFRAPRGGAPGKDAKPVRKIISFEVVPGVEEPPEPTAH